MPDKTRTDWLREAKTEWILEELNNKRRNSLHACSIEELEGELAKRKVDYDGPMVVEKKHGK